MAKNKNNSRARNTSTIPTPTLEADLSKIKQEEQTWNSAFNKASEVLNKDLEIKVDSDFLISIDCLSKDENSTLLSWLTQFAALCDQLNNYKQNLDQEYSRRWEECNQKGQQNIEDEKNNETTKEELKQLSATLTLLERDLIRREENAKIGFEKQNREALEQLINEQELEKSIYIEKINLLKKEKNDLNADIEKAKITYTQTEHDRLKDLQQKEIEHAKAVSAFEQVKNQFEMDKTQLTIAKAHLEREKENYQSKLDIEQKQIEEEWEDLKQAKQNLDVLVDEQIARERAAHKHEVEKLNTKLDSTWKKIEALKTQLLNFEELQQSLAGQPVESFINQLEKLKQENSKLKRDFNQTELAELEQQNIDFRSRVEQLESELKEMRPKVEQAEQEVSQNRIAATQLSSIEQQRRVLEQHKQMLEVHVNDLENRISQLTDAHKTQTPFPAMSNMDRAREFQSSFELEIVPELKDFALELQHRIAQAENIALYYPIEEIRVLLAGLAMSQLHVFQGISGTGKTSLAKAFAKAMGGFCTDIAVQAGWRDRDDLLGHYNAFERKYYEKDCLQALYQAQTPRWKDTCNIILLDEMNLSRPEQYFSEFLSALEKNDPKQRLISLSETALPNAPTHLIQGRQILVPENVWFVGTLNQDETTNELADKTYDRSHVMTLPRQDTSFRISKYAPKAFSLYTLKKRFNEACKTYAKDVDQLLASLAKDNFTTQLANNFDLGWGNRFERQAKRFIPVMLACGATKGEALDHLFSTRVMRQGKVIGRYDITVENIYDLRDSLEQFWLNANLEGEASKSFALLDADIQRKERS